MRTSTSSSASTSTSIAQACPLARRSDHVHLQQHIPSHRTTPSCAADGLASLRTFRLLKLACKNITQYRTRLVDAHSPRCLVLIKWVYFFARAPQACANPRTASTAASKCSRISVHRSRFEALTSAAIVVAWVARLIAVFTSLCSSCSRFSASCFSLLVICAVCVRAAGGAEGAGA